MVAVDNLEFECRQGEIFGLLGPNGAGKTTTIKMLTGQLIPTSGTGSVAGYDIVTESNKIKPIIGVVFERQNLYERLSAKTNLDLFRKLYGTKPDIVEDLLKRVGLSERANDIPKRYSKGMCQRLLIARALVGNPRILFMDEPTLGLDPDIAYKIRQMITELRTEGMTILFTTHYMEEADQLCDRVAFLNKGKIVALDTPKKLKMKYNQNILQVEIKDEKSSSGIRTLEMPLNSSETTKSIALFIRQRKLITVHSKEPSLNDVFIKVTGEVE